MSKYQEYPSLNIGNKNALAKVLAKKGEPYQKTLQMINDCLVNRDKYWRNHSKSDPQNNKWVRDASGTKLGILLKSIDAKLLKPYDDKLPVVIHGGISNNNTKKAAKALLGKNIHRTLLKTDMSRFYEHIPYEAVQEFFYEKTGCSKKVSSILAQLCCVPEGEKPSDGGKLVLARGFATSERLAIWCNLAVFQHIFWKMQKDLKNYDPRMSVYIDDIGITASRVEPERMAKLFSDIKEIVYKYGSGLELNIGKTKIVDYLNQNYDLDGKPNNDKARYEFVGIEPGRRSLRVNAKTRKNIMKLKQKKNRTEDDNKKLKGLCRYAKYISRKDEKISNPPSV